MLINSTYLNGLAIRATDGEMGTVDQFYFDDQTWTIRYFVVKTGGWLSGRNVLISPLSILHSDWQARRLDVSLTMKQVENSPNIDTQKPVSRQHEFETLGYYGYAPYWGGPYMGGGPVLPQTLPIEAAGSLQTEKEKEENSHLRSSDAVSGYSIEATDGDIGHLEGFVVDDEGWAIRYIEVATRNWWPGKKVVFSPAWIERVSWAGSKVRVGLSRETIKEGPTYLEATPITREYESRLFTAYGRPPYWSGKAGNDERGNPANLSFAQEARTQHIDKGA